MNFNGHNTPNYTVPSGTGNITTGTVTYPYNPYPYQTEVKFDEVKYCPFCGKKFPETTQMISFCPYCGQQIPRTTTNSMFVFHWNAPDGTQTWPRDGIVQPYTTCNTK